MKRKSFTFLYMILVLVFGMVLLMHSSNSWALNGALATGTPTSFKVTVIKVEMWNGTSWVNIFEGSSELNLVGPGTFPGISNLTLPDGTYSKIRVKINNAFQVLGSVEYDGSTWHTTAASYAGPGEASVAKTDQQAEYTFKNPDWGALNAERWLPDENGEDIDPPVVVNGSTDYQPTLRFTLSQILNLYSNRTQGSPELVGGADQPVEVWYITLSSGVSATIVLP